MRDMGKLQGRKRIALCVLLTERKVQHTIGNEFPKRRVQVFQRCKAHEASGNRLL